MDTCQLSCTSWAGAGPLPVPAYPTEACGAASSLRPTPLQQTRNQGLRCEQSSRGNTQQQEEASQQTRGRAGTRAVQGRKHFRTWLLRHPQGTGPLQPGGVITAPLSPGPLKVRLWVLNVRELVAWRGPASRRAAWECGSRAGLTHLHSSCGALLDVWVRWVSKTPGGTSPVKTKVPGRVSRGLFHGLVFGDRDRASYLRPPSGLQGLSEPGARGWRWAAPRCQHPPGGRQVRGGLGRGRSRGAC